MAQAIGIEPTTRVPCQVILSHKGLYSVIPSVALLWVVALKKLEQF